MLNEQSRRASLQVAPLAISKPTFHSNSRAVSPATDMPYYRQQGHGDRFAGAQAHSQAHMTPPTTPSTSQEDVSATQAHVDADFDDMDVDSDADVAQVFHSFLRASHPFDPTMVQMDDAIMMPLKPGDLIMVHSIHTNGWADGTHLVSNSRGWLPTNYCRPYDPESMHNLLQALLLFYDLLHCSAVRDREMFVNQEFIKGMIAGVRHLLQRTNSLTKESNAAQINELLKKGRKSLLNELSSLVKTAKKLQALQTLGPVGTHDLDAAVEEMTRFGFRLVFRAAKFLDTFDSDRGTRAAQNCDIMETVPEEAWIPPTSPPPTEPSSFGTRPRAPSPASAKRRSGPVQLPGQPGSNRRSGTASRSSHRASFAGPTPTSQGQDLVSQRLGSSHDAFLSQLSSFIGRLHLQSQSRREVALAVKQAAASGAELLAVVDAVVNRSSSTADILGDSRTAMWERIRDLVFAARDISGTHHEADFILTSDNIALRTTATGCVKAAGDCVANIKWIMERIGDFEFERHDEGLGIDLSMLDFSAVAAVADDSTSNTSTVKNIVKNNNSTNATNDTNNELPTNEIPTNDDNNDEHDQVAATTPHRETKKISLVTSFTTTTAMAYMNKPLPQVPTPSSPTQSHGPASPPRSRRSSTMTVSSTSSSSVNVLPPLPEVSTPTASAQIEDNGDVSPSDCRQAPSFDSVVNTVPSQSRHSEASMISTTSTRATTPDSSQRTTYGSFSSISTHSSITTTEEVDDVESQLMEKTFAQELMFNKEGQVTAGSLPALVERLTTHESTPDSSFVSTFCLTFRLFCTPEELAQALIDRFEYVAETSKVASPVRLRVYNVFKGWLESNWRDEKDRAALPIIKNFAETSLAAAIPSAGHRLMELATRVPARGSLVPRQVSSIVKTTVLGAILTPVDAPAPAPIMTKSQTNALSAWRMGGNTPSVVDFDPVELARQLTLKQMSIFCSIMPEELLASQWMKNGGVDAPNVKAMSSFSTDLSNLVSESILEHSELKKRAAVIKQWIKVGQACNQINNYDGLMAIVCSLNSSIIHRLRKTWDAVSQKRRDALKELQETVEPRQNHKALRSRLHDHVPPCLPFLGMYLTDLTFVDIGNPATKQLQTMSCEALRPTSQIGDGQANRGLSVINFDKHSRTAKIIGELQRFQLPYRFAEVTDLHDWLAAQISRVRESPDHANAQVRYYRQSLMLEPRETPLGASSINGASLGGSAVNGHGGLKTPIEGGPMWGWIRDRSHAASQA